MHHVAIMRPSWKLTEKILSGEKCIESRWYNTKYPPWDRIKTGDVVFFKEGKFVSAKADVYKVLQFDNLNEKKVAELLDTYAKDDGIADRKNFFFQIFRDKKYCILIFLKNAQEARFQISKKGFGNMASWICVDDVSRIRS